MITGFLNLIYIIFPYFCYCIYIMHSKSKLKEENLLFFDFALISSFYLCVRFGNTDYKTAFLINIPLIIALYSKRNIISFLLIIITSFFLSEIYNVNLYIYIISYMITFILNIVVKDKLNIIFILAKILFVLFVLVFTKNDIINFNNYVFLLQYFVLIIIFSYLFILFYKKINQTMKLYSSLQTISKEKKLYESLFKITHEIKNPLAVCKGYLDMFDINNKNKANKYINIINQEIDRTLLLLKDFSNVSKINIKKEKMDISMLLFDVCDEASLMYTNDVKFNYTINENDVYIDGDYNRLKQVLINVLKNAKEAIKSNGNVILTTKKTLKNYIIIIRDDGVGMDKETFNSLGKPFYTTKKNGTGLGVCFSKEIIERHNGIITYNSKQNKGTTVKIILPLKK